MKILQCTFIVCLFLLSACSSEQKEEVALPITIATDAQARYDVAAFQENGAAVTFSIQNPTDCSVMSDQQWCKVVTKQASPLLVNIEIESNTEALSRTAHITLSSEQATAQKGITIVQAAAQFQIVDWKENFDPVAGEYTFSVLTDAPWKLQSNAEWITFTPSSGSANATTGAIEVKASVRSNDTGVLRMAKITLLSGDGKLRNAQYEGVQCEPWETEVRVGDPAINFDASLIDPVYAAKIAEWQKAGVEGGIPTLETLMNDGREVKYFDANTSVGDIVNYMEEGNKYRKRIVVLRNGEYLFDQTVRMYTGCTLTGESKDGVIIKVQKDGGLSLYNINGGGGIRNLTITGDWSNIAPNPGQMEETLTGKGGHIMVNMKGARNAYVDNIRIKNSASHPIWISGNNNTIRDVEIDGAYNKGGGCQGYFFIDGNHQLITGCSITRIRHISLQNTTSKQNVLYKNDFGQEISFHNSDGGDNLIEHNRITLPTTLSNDYYAIMGPWSIQHQVGGKNFILRNRCVENNHRGKIPWSDNALYVGPWDVKPADLYTQFRKAEEYPQPTGKTLYPVILKK